MRVDEVGGEDADNVALPAKDVEVDSSEST